MTSNENKKRLRTPSGDKTFKKQKNNTENSKAESFNNPIFVTITKWHLEIDGEPKDYLEEELETKIIKLKVISPNKKYLLELTSPTAVADLIENEYEDFTFRIPTLRQEKGKILVCINKINPTTNISVIEKYLKDHKITHTNLHKISKGPNNINTLTVFKTEPNSINPLLNKYVNINENDEYKTQYSRPCIRTYEPIEHNVLQCKRCHQLKHTQKYCREKRQRCYKCLTPDCNGENCNPSCANCENSHSSYYKGCEQYKIYIKELEQRINTQKTEDKIMNKINKKNEENLKTYANTLKSNLNLDENNKKLNETSQQLSNLLNTFQAIQDKLSGINNLLDNI